MKTTADIKDIPLSLQKEYFNYDVKMGEHPRYGKNASWNNYKHPNLWTLDAGDSVGCKTYWYAYETSSGHIDVKISVTENVFGPYVYCCIIRKEGESFEDAIFKFWSK